MDSIYEVRKLNGGACGAWELSETVGKLNKKIMPKKSASRRH